MAPNPSLTFSGTLAAGIRVVAVCLMALDGRANLEAGQTVGAQGGFVVVPPDGVVPGAPPGGAPARDQTRRTGTARLRGRVVAADTGQPLRRATVRLMSPEIRESVSTMTDGDGLYEFKELAAGRYTVSASKGSYASLSYGQPDPTSRGGQSRWPTTRPSRRSMSGCLAVASSPASSPTSSAIQYLTPW
jgi:hypothetical protein